ncbi:MAG: hypothetical protein ACK4Q5_03255 [Saprospiraceae bacterium]
MRSTIWNTAIFAFEPTDFDPAKIQFDAPLRLFHARHFRTARRHTHTLADPFLFVKNGRLHLFVEVKNTFEPGKIKCYVTDDLQHWDDLGVVLEADFHLSYPFVFEHEGEVYMMPESEANREIALYRATDFPRCWQKEKVILEGAFNDSSLIFNENRWWLFTSKGYDELHIFHSDSPFGAWAAVPPPPPRPPEGEAETPPSGGRGAILASISHGRNGGGPFRWHGQLLRAAQDCSAVYGGGLHLRRIEKLTPTEYLEADFRADVLPPKSWWNRRGGHHFNCCEFLGKTIVAVDGKADDFLLNRLSGLIFRLLK